MYDITLVGSLVGDGASVEDAYSTAKKISLQFPGRLIRVHDVDGETVIAEYRDGLALARA